jgi:hypothetical protein
VFEIAAVKRPMLAHDQTAGQFGRAEVLHLARQLDGDQPDVDQGTCWRPPIVVMGSAAGSSVQPPQFAGT